MTADECSSKSGPYCRQVCAGALPSEPLTATNTSLGLRTTCTIQFTDVDVNNPFYTFIRCLACRQIVSGYADGTFRPQNNVTRGQMAAFLVNTFSLP